MGRSKQVKKTAKGVLKDLEGVTHVRIMSPLPDLPKQVAVKFGAGKKYDAGKAPVFRGFIQYFPRAIKSVSMVSAFGAQKYQVAYEEVSYQKVDEGYGRYSDADARHLIEECINPVDADSELEHAQMHAWNAMARLEMLLKGRE